MLNAYAKGKWNNTLEGYHFRTEILNMCRCLVGIRKGSESKMKITGLAFDDGKLTNTQPISSPNHSLMAKFANL